MVSKICSCLLTAKQLQWIFKRYLKVTYYLILADVHARGYYRVQPHVHATLSSPPHKQKRQLCFGYAKDTHLCFAVKERQ